MSFDDSRFADPMNGQTSLDDKQREADEHHRSVQHNQTTRQRVVIVWRVDESCSLGCRFCGYSRELNWPRASADPQRVLALGRVLREVQQCHGKTFLVSWLGGEPLAWRELARVSGVFCQDYGLQLGVTTNGMPLASSRIRRSLLADYQQVTISIDGLAPFHDQVRGQAGLFEQLRRNVDRLRTEDGAKRLWLRVNIVLMRGNIGNFGEFCEVMADWGFHELTFNALGGNERPEFFASNRLLPQQVGRFAEQLPGLRDQMADQGLRICGGPRYLDRLEALSLGRPVPIADCRPGSEFLFVDAQGRISPCSFSSRDYGIALDEVRSAAEFLDLPNRFRQRRGRLRLAACDDCCATHIFQKFACESSVQDRLTTEAAC